MDVTKKQKRSDSSHKRKIAKLFSKIQIYKFTNYFMMKHNYGAILLQCCAMSIGNVLQKFWRSVLCLSSRDHLLLGLRESQNAGKTIFWKVGKIYPCEI